MDPFATLAQLAYVVPPSLSEEFGHGSPFISLEISLIKEKRKIVKKKKKRKNINKNQKKNRSSNLFERFSVGSNSCCEY